VSSLPIIEPTPKGFEPRRTLLAGLVASPLLDKAKGRGKLAHQRQTNATVTPSHLVFRRAAGARNLSGFPACGDKISSCREINILRIVHHTCGCTIIDMVKGWSVLQSILGVIAALRVFLPSRSDTGLEVLALRQQLAVLKRKRPRPALRRCWSRWADALVLGVARDCCPLASDWISPTLAVEVTHAR
jgi:hypothetical protein